MTFLLDFLVRTINTWRGEYCAVRCYDFQSPRKKVRRKDKAVKPNGAPGTGESN